MRYYSVIVPVYNRPQEVLELLDSLGNQTFTNFEILIIEDGSDEPCEQIVKQFEDRLDIRYFFKSNSGQGFSRNYGFERAKGDYFVVFDSDCLIPENYFETVDRFLNQQALDVFGGPDKAHGSFTPLQKAISYSMTSPFTTGGIRGNEKHVGVFHPRSFNMGISRQVFEKTGGYLITRMGEDIEFSLRAIEHGFKTGLISEAFVYHKRRTSLRQFFRQLHFFGRARINIKRFFPSELKAVHALPAVFVIGLILWPFSYLLHPGLFLSGGALLSLFVVAVFFHSLAQSHSLKVALLSVSAAFTQLTAYGIGMLTEAFRKADQPLSQK
ncbi:MAG: glycosyltransferase [Roseivirga sp.]|nr:glycosyltransferase [Roseivirga sp.]